MLRTVTGDDELRGPMTRRLRAKLATLSVGATKTAYDVSVHATRQVTSADDVAVSCRATIVARPRQTIAGSLSSRAEARGEGVDLGELTDDAVAACADDLAVTLERWLRRH